MRALGKKHEPTLKLNTMGCLILAGRTHAEVGQIMGCSREHVTRCLESPVGMDMLEKLRRDTQSAIFDPVTDQLQTYAKQAMQEIWDMRNTVESEKLRKDILLDVMHMAGYRPHTNTDNQVEQLPTIVIRQNNVQVNNTITEPRDEDHERELIPVAVAEVQHDELTNPRRDFHEAAVEGDTEPFSIHEVWGRESGDGEKQGKVEFGDNDDRPGGREADERSRESDERSARSRELAGEESWEPSFTNE